MYPYYYSNPPRSNYSESPHSVTNLPMNNSSPPYPSHDPPEYRSPYAHSDSIDLVDVPRNAPQPPHHSLSQSELQPQQPQKSMFDFVSPFDALPTNPSQVKKKPVPSQPSIASTEDSGWSAVSDPKRRSVDNLLEQMTSLRPYPQSVHAYDLYDPSPSEYTSMESVRPLPQQPSEPKAAPAPKPPAPQRQESPPPRRPSPQKTQTQRARLGESPAGSQQGATPGNGRRDKESSPGPRGTGSIRRGRGGKNFTSPKYVFYPASFIYLYADFTVVLNHRPSSSTCPNRWMRSRLPVTLSSPRPLLWSSKRLFSFLERRSVLRIGSRTR